MRARESTLCALAVVLCLGTATTFGQYYEPSNLAANLIDAPSGSGAGGAAALTFDPVSWTLRYDIESNVATDVIGLHIHGNNTKLYLSSKGHGVYTMTEERQVKLLLSGELYIAIHTEQYPDGEVAGFIVARAAGENVFTVQAVSSMVTNRTDSGEFAYGVTAYGTYTGTDIVLYMYWSDPEIQYFELYENAPLGSEGSLVPLCNIGLATTALCDVELVDLEAGEVALKAFGAGGVELYRGQVLGLSTGTPVNAYNFISKMEKVPGSGAGIVDGLFLGAYDAVSQTLSFDVWFNEAAFDVLLYSNSSTLLLDVCTVCSTSPQSGVTPRLTHSQIRALFDGEFVIVTHNIGGNDRIKGSITVGNRVPGGSNQVITTWATSLTTTQTVPLSTGEACAGAFRMYIDSADVIQFDLFTTCATAASTHIVFGEGATVGSTGNSSLNLAESATAIDGTKSLTGSSTSSSYVAEFDAAIATGQLYIEMRDAGGQPLIRGNLAKLVPAQPPTATHYALLTPEAEVVTPPVFSDANGLALLMFDPVSLRIYYRIFTADIASAVTKVHFHFGAAGTNGVLEIAAAGTGSNPYRDPTRSPLVGETNPLTYDQALSLANGNWYINIHTTAYPNGELRGQIYSGGNMFTAQATGYQEVAADYSYLRVSGNSSVALFEIHPQTAQTTFWYYYSMGNESLTGTHFHYGAGLGYNSGAKDVLGDFAPAAVGESIALSTEAAVNARASLAYINFHTLGYPNGNIRGQISPISTLVPYEYPTAFTHVAELSGSAVVPSVATTSSGLAVLAYDDESDTLAASVWHDVDDATRVTVYSGIPGTNGEVVFDLCTSAASCSSPAELSKLKRLTSAQLRDLKVGDFYIQIASAAAPAGEVRGQIVGATGTQFVGTGGGGQETPPIETSGKVGVHTWLDPADTDTLHYSVWHSVGDPSAVHFHIGDIGSNAGSVAYDIGGALGYYTSPLKGSLDITTIGGGLTALLNGQFYVNVHSYSYPSGEARAQALALASYHIPVDSEAEFRSADEFTGFAVLTPPSGVVSVHRGVGLFLYDPLDRTIVYNAVHDAGRANVTGIHLHGTNSTTKIYLSASGEGVSPPLTRAQAFEFLTGGLYINIHTKAWPSGELSGVVTFDDGYYCALATGSKIPTPSNAPGAAVALFNGVANINFASSYPAVTDVTVYQDGVNILGDNDAGTLVCSSPGLNPSYSCAGLSTLFLDSGIYYVEFERDDVADSVPAELLFKANERQFAINPPIDAATHFAVLAAEDVGSSSVGSASGLVLFSYSSKSRSLSYTVWHNVPNVLDISIVDGEGGVIHAPPLAPSPVTGTVTLSVAGAVALVSGEVTVAITSSDDPGNQVLGGATVFGTKSSGELNFAAVCSDDQEVPSPTVATGHTCAALLTYKSSSDRLTWTLWHDVDDATGLHLHYGTGARVGGTTTTKLELDVLGSGTASPATGSFNVGSSSTTSAELLDATLLDGEAYINIHSTTNPNGDTRGQVAALATAYHPRATHVAWLEPSQETAYVESDASGVATVVFDPTDRTAYFHMIFSGLTSSVTKIHLHSGYAGSDGPLVEALAGTGTTVDVDNPFSGTTAALSLEQTAELLSDGFYFNIHTADYPNGELRGQIVYSSAYYAVTALGATQTPPRLGTPYVGLGLFSVDTDSVLVDCSVHTDLGSFHSGTNLVYPTPLGASLPSSANNIEELDTCSGSCSVPLTASGAALGGGPVVNARFGLVSLDFAAVGGSNYDLVGPLLPLQHSVIPTIPAADSFVNQLSASEVVPPSGSGEFGVVTSNWNDKTNVLFFELWHTVDGATSISLNSGVAGVAGTVYAELCSNSHTCGSPLIGSVKLNDTAATDLFNGDLYYEIASGAYPSGSARGQIWTPPGVDGVFGATGDGTQEVPPVNSVGGGAVFLSLTAGSLDFLIIHDFVDISKVHLHSGVPGENGALEFDVGTSSGNLVSPVMGTVSVSAGQEADLFAGEFYLNLHSYTWSAGAARAQAYEPTNSATVFPSSTDSTSTSSTTTSASGTTTSATTTSTSASTSSTPTTTSSIEDDNGSGSGAGELTGAANTLPPGTIAAVGVTVGLVLCCAGIAGCLIVYVFVLGGSIGGGGGSGSDDGGGGGGGKRKGKGGRKKDAIELQVDDDFAEWDEDGGDAGAAEEGQAGNRGSYYDGSAYGDPAGYSNSPAPETAYNAAYGNEAVGGGVGGGGGGGYGNNLGVSHPVSTRGSYYDDSVRADSGNYSDVAFLPPPPPPSNERPQSYADGYGDDEGDYGAPPPPVADY